MKALLAKIHILDTRAKRIVALVLASVALVISAYCLLRFGFSIDILDGSGWHVKGDTVQYRDYFGKPQLGWQYIENKLYYFDTDGNMTTGWQTIDGDRYYLGTDGVRTVGWQTVDGQKYYLGDSGKMVVGWNQIDGKSYLFTDTGAMATGWQTIDGKRSYFSQEGMALTGWQTIEEKLYYFTEDGYTLSGAVELDGIRYQFTEEGAVLTGWVEDETGKYYLDAKGQPHTGWLELEDKRYYFNEKGVLTTGWVTEGNDRYYLYPDGRMAIGQVVIDETTHFFTSKGKWVLFANPWNPVPEDYVVKLVSIEGFRFDSVGRDSLQAMLNGCREAGFNCTINNTYRSKATQQYMWNKSVAQFMAQGMTQEEAEAETGKDTALPGHSEHQTGLAVDVNGDEATYAWLAEHCWDYGFILRYPDNKIDITGIIYEPWHFRYVGTELALELKELGLCMEEYMTQITAAAQQPEVTE